MKKCFIVYRDGNEQKTVEVDTSKSIYFTSVFVEYETKTEIIQDDIENIVKIYFE